MYRARRNKDQNGMALVVGLILLAAVTIITVAGMQGMQMQERMTSNQNNKALSRMAAEAGVSALWASLQGQSVLPQSASALNLPESQTDATLLSQSSRAAYWFDPSEWDIATGTTLRAMAVGQALDSGQDSTNPLSETRLVVRIALGAGAQGPSFFDDGVVGCEGVNMVGSGQVDSFNSEFGPYGSWVSDSDGNSIQNSLRTNVTVRTIDENATFNLSGNAPIYGNVTFTGSQLDMSGGTPVHGNVQAEGNVDANGTIYGTLSAGGNIVFGTASTQQGAVTSGGNVTVDSTANPPSTITAAGDIVYPDWWQWDAGRMDMVNAGYQGSQNIDIPSVLTGELCDQANLRDGNGNLGPMFSDTMSNAGSQRITDYLDGSGYSENSQSVSLTGPGGPSSSRTIGNDDTETVLWVDNDLKTSGNLNEIVIRGNVTLMVDGDFELSNNTQLLIEENATLKLLVTGETKLSGGSNLLTDSSFVRGESMEPAVVLYSAYESTDSNDVGVFVGGANNSHVAVYAPYATARYVGSGEIFGATRAKYVDIRGNGDIHYDEMLKDMGESAPSTSAAEWSIISWQEHLN